MSSPPPLLSSDDENEKESIKCLICQSVCILPTEIMCFPCNKTSALGCMSLLRFCMHCALRYLQWEDHKKNRSIKCVYCDTVISLGPNTKLDQCLRKDYLLMRADTKKRTCPWCNEFTDYQMSLDHHMTDTCLKRRVLCSCGTLILFSEQSQHKKVCIMYTQCSECHETISVKEIRMHLLMCHEISHCFQCSVRIPNKDLGDHVARFCPNRITECPFCHEVMNHQKLFPHLDKHKEIYDGRIHTLRRMIRHYLRQKERIDEYYADQSLDP